ncbi:hypothetical protein F2P81_002672 [Scophthalmus maximus]|uniref:Uncharacterized protein n=1 Tax=Scophthalmus maximus TaxID=52904 RepID=A0A6A4TJE5_SCOMX|nr:hypothetical protein F2P81_002672 [Scophthalmus maximus]
MHLGVGSSPQRKSTEEDMQRLVSLSDMKRSEFTLHQKGRKQFSIVADSSKMVAARGRITSFPDFSGIGILIFSRPLYSCIHERVSLSMVLNLGFVTLSMVLIFYIYASLPVVVA